MGDMPPSPKRTLYDVLGVSRNASQDDIKKRFRELARQHHPDVNPGNAGSARRFAEITAAYKTLSDGSARSLYDSEVALAERQAATAAARAAGPPRNGAPASGGSPAQSTTPPRPAAGSPNDQAMRLVQQAQAALVRMKFVEARDLAQQSLRARRTAEGYEVLGDVYRLQGRSEQAMDMYTMSLQINPRNQRVMERLERLARSSGGGRGGGGRAERRYDTASSSARPFPAGAAGMSAGSSAAALPNDKRPIALLLASLVGYSLVAFLLLYQWFYGGQAPLRPLTPLPFISSWNDSLLWVLPASGFVLGATMAITQFIRRIDDELIFTAGSRANPVPVGVLLIVLSLLSFWAAALLHLILSALQEARVDSILRVFGGVAFLVLFLTAVYDPGRSQVFLFGGNVAFVAFLAGWALGDIFRPDL